MASKPNLQELAAENHGLRARLERAEESLRDILSGEADALFVAGTGGAQLFALKGADQSYRTLIENMSEGALTLTPAGLILYANQRFAKMLGAPLEKVIGSEIHTWFPRESRPVLQTLLRSDAVDNRREELALAAADGSRVPVNLSVSRLTLDEMPDSLCMVATDLTEQKRNAAILAAEKLSNAILEQSGDAIVICDEAGLIIRASKRAHMLCGKNPAGQYFERAFPLCELDGTAFSSISAIDTSDRQSIEATLEGDGKTVDLLVSVGHLKGTRDELLGSVVTLTDITARKNEQAQRERMAALVEASPDFVGFADPKTARIEYINRSGRLMCGIGEDEELGELKISDVHPAWMNKLMAEVILPTAACNGLWEGEGAFLHRNGHETPVSMALFGHKAANGEVDLFYTISRDITERNKVEQVLRESERRFSELLDNVELISMMLDREARITYCNEYLLRLTGWQRDELIGRNWFEVFVPPEISDLKGDFFAALLTNLPETRHHENEILTRSGERRLIRWNNSVLRSGSGEVIGTASLGDDITEQKRAEHAVVEIQRKSDMILASVEEGIYGMDLEGIIIFKNPAAARLLGYGSDELLGKLSHTTLHYARKDGTPYPRAECPMQLTMIDGMVRRVDDDMFWRKDGSGIPVEYTTAPLRDDQNAISGVVVAFRDVTERKKAEQALHQSENDYRESKADAAQVRDSAVRLQAILDTVVDGVITIDGRGNIATFNPAAERIFGYAADAVVGRNVKMLMPEPYHSEHDTYLEHYRTAGEARIIGSGREVRGQRQDGSTFPLDLAVSEMILHDERHYTGVVRDITGQKAAEQAVVNARIEAERANAAKNTFLATMSHEIRTPMNGVIGMVDVLAHSRLSEHQNDLVGTIRESASTLLGIIDDILDFSKIEAGRLEIERAPVSVADLVEGLCNSLVPVASRRGADLSLFISPQIPERVLSDDVRLRQVLYNLVGNAIKFSAGRPEKRGHVSVRVEVAQAAPLQLVFRIADNGIGMAAKTMAELFTPFTQAEISTTRRFGGTGLGLAICKRLVDLMQGRIAVESTPGAGSTFSVTLPLEPAEEQPVRVQPDLSGLDCLIVRDRQLDAEDLRTYLEHAGARVRLAASVAAAQAAASLSGPVVVIQHAGLERPAPDKIFSVAPNVHHLLITRGRRRRARIENPDLVTLDGDALRRQTLLRAVAVAVGRASPEVFQKNTENLLDEAAAPFSIADARTQGRLILVAEDDEINQKVILQQLGLLGYAAEVAGNGMEALQLWREGSYALLLTDLHMPEMDGYTLTETIRREETGHKRMPILALTANALRGEANRARAAGMDEYLTKPVQLHLLGAALEKWLPRKSGEAASAELPQTTHDGEATTALNVAILKGLVGDDEETVREFLGDYLASARRLGKELRAASAAGDTRQIGAIAHKLKSSSRSVGALALADLCTELENAGRAGDKAAISQDMPKFEAAMTVVEAEIGALLTKPYS